MSNERLRNPSFTAGPDTAIDEFDTSTPTSTGEGNIDVIHGVFAHTAPFAGMTVRHARAELEERMNIDPEATTFVDGNEVDEDTVLEEGQVLNFVKHAGERGHG